MNIAFYAPLKAPDHPVPSGDRQMARQLIRALEMAGHRVVVASRFCSFEKTGEIEAQKKVRREAEAALQEVEERFRAEGPPDLWFTYHSYYKAPDWLGPAAAKGFGLAYVTCESSYAAKRSTGPFAEAQQQVRVGLEQAAVNFCFTDGDREGLEKVARAGSLVELPPFVDLGRLPAGTARVRREVPQLLAVGMMRAGDKLDSYRILAKSLFPIRDLSFSLAIAGDGPERNTVETLFGFLGDRVQFLGEAAPEDMAEIYAGSDLYVWPGCGEAYGLAYLEAQAMGLPVVAQRIRGVPAVVLDGVSGILTDEGFEENYSGAISRFVVDRGLRLRMGQAAEDFVRGSRGLEHAADILRAALK
ncbi:glycosyltransferase involved in cell wall biosynthesis [Rhodoligotrophos appendicifer]|uniref:glycosyltransferase family 4 protein n=1 Tax=Rhodoligotrophos appendicifer TaxID=987056 RepID=UPI0011846C80|nr:glycosyltransferase family 4 protein [Rhodoligotrophos appendicifer]